MALKALLVIPSHEKVYGMKMAPAYPPLGVLYIASVLIGRGVEVGILDADADKMSIDDILSEIEHFDPAIVGITATTPTMNEAKGIAEVIKRHRDIPIILGGIHPTLNPEECIAWPCFDFVIKGEGETTIGELADVLKAGTGAFETVKGIYYKKNGSSHFTGERELIADLDTIPFPARHLLRNISCYKPPDAEKLPVASIMTTRGCPGRCTYCCTKNIFKDRYRMRGIDNVLEEIELLISRFKVKEIHIADDAFNSNKRRTLSLCEAIAKKSYPVNFEFLNGLRADTLDDDMLDAFRSIGVKNVGFGVESADRDILKHVKKSIMPEDVERAMRISKKKGFKTWLFFMIGLPGETEETIKRTIEFAKDVDPDFAKFLIFKPFPGSDIFDEINGAGLIDDKDYDHYGVYTPPVHNLPSLSKADLVSWQKKAFREFYFRPKKIWDHLIRQRSLAQLKLSLRGLSFVYFNATKKGGGS